MFAWVIKILPYERIDLWEGIDIDRSNKSKECIIWHYWCFKDIGYKFEPHVCNGCLDISLMASGLENIAILNGKSLVIYLFYEIWLEMMKLYVELF